MLLLLFCANITMGRSLVEIRTQRQFDELQQRIVETILAGDTDIKVLIKPGTYVAHEKHLSLINVIAPETTIRIIGEKAVIIPQGKDYYDGDAYHGSFSPNNSWMTGAKDVPVWSDIRYADGLIEVVDEIHKVCRLKSIEPLNNNADAHDIYILLPHWFRSSVYRIDSVQGQFLYFVAPDLSVGYKQGYNVNDDYNYGQQPIRYKLCNKVDGYLRIVQGRVVLPKETPRAREGKVKQFVVVDGCHLKSMEMNGLQFLGNSFVENQGALCFCKNDCREMVIRNCSFNGIRSNVITLFATPNVSIEDNSFCDCYYQAVMSDNGSAHTIVKGNTFTSMGKRVNNTPCVRCSGENYHIVGNTFIDYGYCAVKVGVWYKHCPDNLCYGIVENNNMLFSNSYISCISDYGLMDGGAIYVCTKNNGVIIRANNIHGYVGLKSNRGIFCDDGAFNFQLIGNKITQTPNGNSIDARRVKEVEESVTLGTGVANSNVNNVIRNNFVDGKIIFAGNERDENGCVKGVNYILLPRLGKFCENIYQNVYEEAKDIFVDCVIKSDGTVEVNRKDYKNIKKSEGWNLIKHHTNWFKIREF